MDSIELLRRARWSYEAGRLRVGLPGFVLAAFVVLYALSRPHTGWTALIGGTLLATAVVAGVWRRVSARAVVAGLLAGVVPLAGPLLAMRAGMGCGLHDCTTVCLLSCLVGGFAAGTLIGWWSTKLLEDRRLFLGVAGAIGTLAGALGCLEFGAMGLLLLLGGSALVLSPAWVLAPSGAQPP